MIKFKSELKNHDAVGYHNPKKYDGSVREIIQSLGLSLNEKFTSFLQDVGYGNFFDNGLTIFPLEFDNLISHDFVRIGYYGTTEGYLCISTDASNEAVFWFDNENEAIEMIHADFFHWLDEQVDELFDLQGYKGFKKIKHPEGVKMVLKERAQVEVELLKFESPLVKLKKEDFLPRYNRLILLVLKKRELTIDELTIRFFRSESSIGEDNLECVTIDIGSIPVGKSQVIEAHLFDPFNLPFQEVQSRYSPDIDLGSKTRVMYKEIVDYL